MIMFNPLLPHCPSSIDRFTVVIALVKLRDEDGQGDQSAFTTQGKVDGGASKGCRNRPDTGGGHI